MVNVMGDALATGIMAHICRKDFMKEGDGVSFNCGFSPNTFLFSAESNKTTCKTQLHKDLILSQFKSYQVLVLNDQAVTIKCWSPRVLSILLPEAENPMMSLPFLFL